MAFRTRLDYSNNRQIRQTELTNTQLSGATIFGMDYNSLGGGIAEPTTVIGNLSGITSTFIGNTSTTNHTFGHSSMIVASSNLLPINPNDINSLTQTVTGYEGVNPILINGNLTYQYYTGSTYTLSATSITQLSPNNWSGETTVTNGEIFSGSSLDYTGSTVWVDVRGGLNTKRLIIEDDLLIDNTAKILGRDIYGNIVEVQVSGGTGTNYTAGNGLNLVGTVFSQDLTTNGTGSFIQSLTQTPTGIQVNLGTPPNTTYSIFSGTSLPGLVPPKIGTSTDKYLKEDGTWDYPLSGNSGALIFSPTGNTTGIIISGRDEVNYGNVGDFAIDLSYSDAPFNVNGATGDGSLAFGLNTIASGVLSTAWGEESTASGVYSTAWGDATIASGFSSTTWGRNAKANNDFSTAWGYKSEANGPTSTAWGAYGFANGHNSTAFGYNVTANSVGEVAMGMFSTIVSGNATDWVGTDRILSVGNGSPSGVSDALIILKRGDVIAPSLSMAIISTGDSRILITKEYADANYSGGGSSGPTNLGYVNSSIQGTITSSTGTNAIIPLFSSNIAGLVPARVGSTTNRYLREDGTWVTPSNTTYSAGNGLNLVGTTFSQVLTTSGSGTYVQSLTQTPTGIQVNLGTPPTSSNAVYTGSTAGLVPQRDSGGTINKFLREDGSWVEPPTSGGGTTGSTPTNLGYTNSSTQGTITSSTGTSAIIPLFSTGVAGLVPARIGTVSTKYLREDGTWVTPTNTTYSTGTLSILNTGTSNTVSVYSPLVLNQWLNGKGYLSSFTETDPTVPTYAKSLTDFNVIKTSTDALYEPIFNKNSGFNKNFGTSAGTVAQGNDSRINNGNTAFTWGNHASEGYVKTDTTYSAGNGLNLVGTTFSQVLTTSGSGNFIQSLTQTPTGIQVNMGNPVIDAYTKTESDNRFLLSSLNTIKTGGYLRMNTELRLQFATNSEFFASGSDTYIDISVGKLIVRNSLNIQNFVLQQNGNLGLGITTPSEKLDVGGNIKASGLITSNSGLIGGKGHVRTYNQNADLAQFVHNNLITNYTNYGMLMSSTGTMYYGATEHNFTAGNINVTGNVNSAGFIRVGSSGSYVLLGDGGHSRLKTVGGVSIFGSGDIPVSGGSTYSAGNGLNLVGTTFSQVLTTSGSGTYVQSLTQTSTGIQVNLGTPPNTNTTYSAGNGLNLVGTVFSQVLTTNGTGSFIQSLTQTSTGIQVNLGNPPNTTYSAGSNITISGGNQISVVNNPTFTGNVTAPAFYESSLRELKENILPFKKSGVELINELNIVTFNRKDKSAINKIGIIADDSPKEFLSEELDSVDLYKTIFIQSKAIQELYEEIKNLKKLLNGQRN